MVYVGIDPGKAGGYAILYPEDSNILNRAESFYWDEQGFIDKMNDLAQTYGTANIITCVEQVHSMPTDSHKTAFSFGYQNGFIKAVLLAYKIPYQEISPVKWKKEFGLVKQPKDESIKCCKKLYPLVSLFRTNKCKKESDGMAEALLMATYAKRKF